MYQSIPVVNIPLGILLRGQSSHSQGKQGCKALALGQKFFCKNALKPYPQFVEKVFDTYLLLGLSSLFCQYSCYFFKKLFFNCYTFEKLTKNILSDCFCVMFISECKKKPNFQNGQRTRTIGQHGNNFVIFSQAIGQTWYHTSTYHLSTLEICQCQKACCSYFVINLLTFSRNSSYSSNN